MKPSPKQGFLDANAASDRRRRAQQVRTGAENGAKTRNERAHETAPAKARTPPAWSGGSPRTRRGSGRRRRGYRGPSPTAPPSAKGGRIGTDAKEKRGVRHGTEQREIRQHRGRVRRSHASTAARRTKGRPETECWIVLYRAVIPSTTRGGGGAPATAARRRPTAAARRWRRARARLQAHRSGGRAAKIGFDCIRVDWVERMPKVKQSRPTEVSCRMCVFSLSLRRILQHGRCEARSTTGVCDATQADPPAPPPRRASRR